MQELIDHLPLDWKSARLLGRLQTREGPTPILVSGGRVSDVSRVSPTVSEFLECWKGELPASGAATDLGPLEQLPLGRSYDGLAGADENLGGEGSKGLAGAEKGEQVPRLLSPFELQCIKASGVTFAISAIERVIEERARGDAAQAEAVRAGLRDRVGADINHVKPGSEGARKLKAALIADGLWSQYLEVAIGPDAEIFTKSPTLSSVGWGEWVGVRSDSAWNNPEPEVVLACDRAGRILGASLGNDVNLRDIEGRSALLLGKAKDNNASCAIGPFIRLFDERFTLDDVRGAVVRLEITGDDGFRLEGQSSMSQISRDPADLVAQTLGKHHQYPDGLALFLGTMFAPIVDRGAPGLGFTHKPGDIVRVSTERLGVLENKVTTCDKAPPWTFGVKDLMRNLAGRGLLGPTPGGRASSLRVKT